ncbi:hypothetical protein ACFQ3P_42480 [Paraburkholderia sabiae]|uniref:Uncharacterized protein n=1 Tax=Paraburkholderia sabiae TaxID=273251 RepID=A0ABU9QS71_9BURK|nr:hypothetical protein [Paraburkholderia sabiae]WJZ80056.1 hypothetical protein QEN71_42790 [Paraburkholderia sabiae]CAD6563212.1 hypothetical protein LMG24235_08454 [Paraburkholderia sabiae]
MMAAARSPARSEPANNQFFLLCRDLHNAEIFLVGGRGNERIAMSSDLIRDR